MLKHNGEGEMKRCLFAAAGAASVALAALGCQPPSTPAEHRGPAVGRYALVVNPADAKMPYLLDTAEGRVWQLGLDLQEVRAWQPLPRDAERLDGRANAGRQPK